MLAFTLVLCIIVNNIITNHGDKIDYATRTIPSDDEWTDDDRRQCESPRPLNNTLSCYTHVLFYERLNTELISTEPIVVVFRDFAPYRDTEGFRNEANMIEREMLVQKYFPLAHYPPHYDYERWDDLSERLGNRLTTLLLIAKAPLKGGASFQAVLFPLLNKTITYKEGDLILWMNADTKGEMEKMTLHADCPVWEGEKVSASLTLRFRHQDLLRAPLKSGKFNLRKLTHPRIDFIGMTPANVKKRR
ncbi:unnamed protein product [Nippostrongylus brasiliensis]|uniref:Fe2OG dioxygenase domain-containing protein n=1 Tax=Nippostrongylus brasiliensis TaxID=27835 RepID=A0A0N4XTU0_NIPBR|nr:unnamed protein product [Nippostrongylus brasiliensis]